MTPLSRELVDLSKRVAKLSSDAMEHKSQGDVEALAIVIMELLSIIWKMTPHESGAKPSTDEYDIQMFHVFTEIVKQLENAGRSSDFLTSKAMALAIFYDWSGPHKLTVEGQSIVQKVMEAASAS